MYLLTGLALVTMTEARLWTDGRYFLQATQELSDQWTLMRLGEDPAVDIWMADVSFRFYKTRCYHFLYELHYCNFWEIYLDCCKKSYSFFLLEVFNVLLMQKELFFCLLEVSFNLIYFLILLVFLWSLSLFNEI